MKNLQNLKGAHLLSKQEQLSINGGDHLIDPEIDCITHGGNWVNIGTTGGCVYPPINPPKEK
jgi:hypothetical protein